jgi:NAD(P)H-hydrate repair Nnr-like enzyme with NAD(P)H-hydrate dehydratase domain
MRLILLTLIATVLAAPTDYIVGINTDKATVADVVNSFKATGGSIKTVFGIIPAFVASMDDAAFAALKKDDRIAYVEVDGVVHTAS